VKRGRPPGSSKAERECRRAWAAREDRLREEIEAKIARGEKIEVISMKEALADDSTRLEDGDALIAAPSLSLSPADQFFYDRVRGVPIERWDSAVIAAFADLLDSDVPLDKAMRHTIAGQLRKLSDPQYAEEVDTSATLQVIDWCRAEGLRRGLTIPETDEGIAKALGHQSGSALRKWETRARKRAKKI
jgi:hypothetical protein